MCTVRVRYNERLCSKDVPGLAEKEYGYPENKDETLKGMSKDRPESRLVNEK